MDIIPSYDVEEIILKNYNEGTRKIILSNLKKYTKLKRFDCNFCNFVKLPDLPNSLTELYCSNNDLTELPSLPNSLIELYCDDNNLTYPNYEIKTINEINKSNFKKKILKRMEVLNRNLLLEHSARITMNPKRIQRLLNTNEINFYDNSFDTLTN